VHLHEAETKHAKQLAVMRESVSDLAKRYKSTTETLTLAQNDARRMQDVSRAAAEAASLWLRNLTEIPVDCDVKTVLEGLSVRLEEYRISESTLKSQFEDSQRQFARVTSQLDRLRSREQSLHRDIQALQEQVAAKEAENATLRSREQSLQATVSSLAQDHQRDIQALQEQVAAKEAENATLRSREQSLQATVSSLAHDRPEVSDPRILKIVQENRHLASRLAVEEKKARSLEHTLLMTQKIVEMTQDPQKFDKDELMKTLEEVQHGSSNSNKAFQRSLDILFDKF
jgi:chromosome segregation ATPase